VLRQQSTNCATTSQNAKHRKRIKLPYELLCSSTFTFLSQTRERPIIGGEIEDWISDKVQVDVPLQNLIPLQDDNNNVGSTHWSEKRALVFSESSVANIGEPLRKKSIIKNKIMIPPPSSSSRVGSKPKPRAFEETIKPAKGQWKKKDRSIPRQWGYENFKRFDTSIDGK